VTAADHDHGRLWLTMIIIGSIPTAVIGFVFADSFRSLFGQPRFVSLMLWVTALILMLSDRRKIKEEFKGRLTVFRSVAVGTAQGLAIIPGISRSGATITTAIFTGMDPALAARYSFLLSIPAIVGAMMMEMKDIVGLSLGHLPAYGAGAVVAFLSGYLAIDVLLRVVVKRNLWKFSVYLFILGLVGLIFT
jgi:undecaprenyl-diphosphatase